ncbi:MAG: N-acetyl-gamma-glutamyl-phosphate reductase [Myxococcota bacterium]
MAEEQTIPVAVVGATGYTGAELLRLLVGHPRVEVVRVCGHGKAGQPIAAVLPSFAGVLDGEVAAFDAADVAEAARVAFCALPHGASAGIVDELRRRGVTVFDLSADFRLRDLGTYTATYGAHLAPERVGEAVYGLVELHRAALRSADLVAVPGCYPTSAILPLAPLLRQGLVSASGIVVDAKSGVSGAGRAPRASTHLPEAAEGIRAYKAGGGHRHVPEIEQELSGVAGEEVRVSFTPHLVPMTRGILATAYATAVPGTTAQACTEAARALYAESPSVVVLDAGAHPDTLWVRGSNRAHVAYAVDARAGRVVAQCALDNLVKGAGGQAVQAFNVRFGLGEDAGLRATAVWP